MNKFQEQLQRAISGVNKVSEIVVSSEKVSQLDLDVLLEKLRNVYNVVISFEDVEDEIVLTKPVIEKVEEKEEIKEEVFLDDEEDMEEEIIDEEDFVEETKELVIEEESLPVEEEKEQEVFVEEKPVEEALPIEEEKEQEVIIEEKPVEEALPIEEEKEQEIFEEEKQEEEQEQIEEIVEPEILFEPEIKEEPKIEETVVVEEKPQEKPRETPSVLKYLNEQMPKQNEIPHKTIDEIFEQKAEDSNDTPKTISEKYEQQKSIFDNISSSVNQEDIASKFKQTHVDLRTAIGVNEKFMFINDLFSGNLREYTDFIQRLNDTDSSEKAIELLMKTKDEKRWVASSLSFTTLKEIMIKKFH